MENWFHLHFDCISTTLSTINESVSVQEAETIKRKMTKCLLLYDLLAARYSLLNCIFSLSSHCYGFPIEQSVITEFRKCSYLAVNLPNIAIVVNWMKTENNLRKLNSSFCRLSVSSKNCNLLFRSSTHFFLLIYHSTITLQCFPIQKAHPPRSICSLFFSTSSFLVYNTIFSFFRTH